MPTAPPQRVPGLDESSVRVAVIADVETGGTADDLFRDAWTAAKAWELEVNSRGGIGGRDVIVATLDTALTNHRAVLEVVCNGAYFAIVGAQSLNDYDGAEMLGTEGCNIADFSGDVHGALRAESANTFIPNPIYNDLRQAGPATWLAQEYPDTIDNVTTFWFEELQLRNETERLFEMLDGLGFTVRTIDTDLDEGPSERILTRFTELESEAIVWNADPDRLIDLLRDFRENEVDLTWVLCEFTCYSQEFLDDGGLAVEGVYTWIPHVPIDSPTADDEFIDYRFFLKQFAPDVGWSEVGMQTWMAGRLFEASFNKMLEVEPEQPTREALVTAARSINGFNANGMLPLTNPGGRQPTSCFALMVVEGGRWVQAHPQPPRDLDCAGDNLYGLTATRNQGLELPVAASSTTSEDVADDDDAIDLDNPEEVPNE